MSPNQPIQYVPQPVFCVKGSNALCSVLPAYIGPDPRLKNVAGYDGLYGPPPTQASGDVQTPFDNMAWQMFVALNWAASAVNPAAGAGIAAQGRRVFQDYRKVSALFGNSPNRVSCTQALALPIFYIGSDGKGKPAPNNEEYFQASTNLPLIDINGELDPSSSDVSTRYRSQAICWRPTVESSQKLTTITGQTNFIKSNPGGAQFTASATT